MKRKLIVGVIHLAPLPGSPRALDSKRVVDLAVRDARVLSACGFDMAFVENFGDAPFYPGRVPAITVACITQVACEIRHAAPELALGINVLRNDAESALAIAHAVDAAAIRVNVHTGARVTDQGMVQGDAANTLRLRRGLGADSVAIWADVDVKHSAPLAPRSLHEETRDLVERGLADAVLVTGEGTGRPVDVEKLRLVRASAGSAPVYVASGATKETVADLLALSDGVIVGSDIKELGQAGAPVDEARARAFLVAARLR